MAFINKEQVKQIREALKKEFPEITFSVRKEGSSSVHVGIMKSPYNFSDLPFFRQDGSTNVNQFRVPDCIHRRLFEKIFRTRHIFQVAGVHYNHTFTAPLYFPEKTDIELRAKGGSAGLDAYAHFDMILVDN